MSYFKSLVSGESFSNVRKTSLVVSGWLCTVGGLVADVLQPLAPFAIYLFGLSLLGVVTLSILYFLGKKGLVGALALVGMSCLASGLIVILQGGGDKAKKQGVVAAAVPAVSQLQERLGLIEKKLDSIKGDTESLKSSAERIESKSDVVIGSLDQIRSKLDAVSSDGIITDPQSPEEHYHNARLHELGGDYAAARRSYLEYFKSDLDKLDPHIRFVSFLRVQEGRAGACEVYGDVTARSSSDLSDYVRLLLLDKPARVAGLKNKFDRSPEFAPVAYHLSLDYSLARLGSQTLADQRQELAYLNSFQKRDEAGGLIRYMIDQTLVEEWRENVEERLAALLRGDAAELLDKPVAVNCIPNNEGWTGTVQIGEPVLEILWRLKDGDELVSTGSSGSIDPRTGQSMPRSFFNLPKQQEDTQVEVRYRDLAGVEQGPYFFDFEGAKRSDDANRRLLEATSSSWASFRTYDGQVLLYFTQLMPYRGALEKVLYGIEVEQPDQEFEFPSWDEAGLAEIDGSFPLWAVVPESTSFASVQLVYKDGDRSAILSFRR
ncbi:hypothetical protein [Pelagicoccus sp. SDUM812002]|uniref:hypothetical protein n=1 Tax=Pelagicoccus sp. SDUM812002 TaxID=3041266 RepID=UPI0028105740|nr:hypothetical protein [Pelagicoccus sp. SDUM812002]MDQ8184692.1 hypothetical protein [Pelagicoccus sp. SDUM812002]